MLKELILTRVPSITSQGNISKGCEHTAFTISNGRAQELKLSAELHHWTSWIFGLAIPLPRKRWHCSDVCNRSVPFATRGSVQMYNDVSRVTWVCFSFPLLVPWVSMNLTCALAGSKIRFGTFFSCLSILHQQLRLLLVAHIRIVKIHIIELKFVSGTTDP